jgi:hypothetical protein
LYIIRGNHDNPILWQYNHSYKLDRITFVEDNTFFVLDGKLCFFAGGAVSIDRCNRILNVSYWEDETYSFYPKFYYAGEEIDILFTHDVYHGSSKYTTESKLLSNYYAKDPNLKSDIIESQEEMKLLYDWVYNNNPKFTWYHGHYHEHNITDNNGQVTYSLGINEFKEVL